MGDVIQRFQVRTSTGRPRSLRVYFDTGSPSTFLKATVAQTLGRPFKLAKPRSFGGMGDGRFTATALMEIEFRFLDLWCPHLVYVLPEGSMEARYDLLAGHDLMQKYDLRPIPRRHEVVIDRSALQMAFRVHR